MNNNDKTETNRIQEVAKDSWYAKGIAPETILYSGKIFCRFIRKGSSVLELGPAEGAMTAVLLNQTDDLTVVEGAPSFCEILRKRYPSVKVTETLFENFKPSRRYDVIVLGHVLEHVADPVSVLRLASGWLAEGGIILAAVPNAQSIHREAAVLMGIIPNIYHLNEADLHHGHRRVYDMCSLKTDFSNAGLSIHASGGYWIKPVSNAQIEQSWTPEMLHAFMLLGERYPDIAAEIYVVADIL
jgi:2-polyprenyl-3-methyl-5-hydroxy-6-metoxy-1,4-benzoquinol methylase